MDVDLARSLNIAQKIIANKKNELQTLTIILQNNPGLDDELIVLFAEFCYAIRAEIEALERIINSIQEQKTIFGSCGLRKELEIVPMEEYPPSQQ